jgi:hypothetical protein
LEKKGGISREIDVQRTDGMEKKDPFLIEVMMSKPTNNSTRAIKCLLEMVHGPGKGALVASAKLAFIRSRYPLVGKQLLGVSSL